MPFRKLEAYVEQEEFCCPLKLLEDRVKWSTERLAEDAGMTPRAMRFWRRLFKKGQLKCPRAPDCAIARDRFRTTRAHRGEAPGSASA